MGRGSFGGLVDSAVGSIFAVAAFIVLVVTIFVIILAFVAQSIGEGAAWDAGGQAIGAAAGGAAQAAWGAAGTVLDIVAFVGLVVVILALLSKYKDDYL